MATRILSVATALPQHRFEPQTARRLLTRLWPRLAAARGAGDAPTRYLAEAPESLLETRSLTSTMERYEFHAVRLAGSASARALAAAGVRPEEIDVVIAVSCTGYLVPSLDVHLAADLGFRADIVRIPIAELGCSGGAAALALAHRYLAGQPDEKVLVVAVEVPSLTFQPEDRSLDNLGAALVFGDGAGAAVLTGAGEGDAGLRIEAAASRLLPGTTAALGYKLGDGGFRIVLDRRLPALVGRHLEVAAGGFCAARGIEGRVSFLAAHGGGPRVLESVQKALGLEEGVMEVSAAAYRAVGNVSSASVLFALGALMEGLGGDPGEGLGLGLGPGVSIELMHLSWRPPAIRG